MTQLDRIAKEWEAAVSVIRSALHEWGVPQSQARAEAIIARLAAHNPPILLEMEEPDKARDLDTGVWFQAGCSGLWYQNHMAAGSITEVRVDGVRFVPACIDAQDEEDDPLKDEPDQDQDYTGPVCSHCRQPVNAHNGTITSGLRQTWLHDSCAAAAEHEWDRKREERE
jgi:hypothetical protein